MKNIISISNRKGGVGKSMITFNLAFELSLKGYKTLLIDLDDQCDLNKLAFEEIVDDYNIVNVFRGKYTIQETSYEVFDIFFVVSGQPSIKEFVAHGNPYVLYNKLQHQELDSFDFILIDHPPSISEVSKCGLVTSTDIIIVSDTETFSMTNIENFISDLEDLKKENDAEYNILGIVVNRVNSRRKLGKQKVFNLRKIMGDVVFSNIISDCTAFPSANDIGMPIRGLSWRSKPIKQLEGLCKEILVRTGVEQ
jgi:chromosome partitioning protein